MTETASFAPDRTTLMIKPVGAMCNLRCTYCYYLPTLAQWGGHERRMSTETLETVFAGALPRWGNQVTIAWQGGEPTLAGLPFFEQALALQRRYARPGQQVANAIQTNGTLIDEQWCRFLRDNRILLGISLDGPTRFHDHYRVDVRSEPTAECVLRGLDLLREHGVEYNVLCVLNDRNVEHPEELLGFFLNRGIRWLQFIPAVEWETDEATGEPRSAPFTPTGEQYGRFLCRLFDLWFERYRASVSIRFFDAVLNKQVCNLMPFCILDGACHNQLTIEHDGSVFGCDHFVEPRWRLGTADDAGWVDRLEMDRLETFAQRKRALPEQCQSCPFLRYCYGGCPKHRPHRGDVAEPTHLCAGYRMFYRHALDRLEWLAGYLRRGQQPPPPAPAGAARRQATTPPREVTPEQWRRATRNGPCPCGSGLKFKRCHGRNLR
ncbi:MAG: anaerobic sulfatase maturase [Phycisphaeraceae bacterium]